MAYIDKINKDSTDYDLQDSKAARSVDGTTASHVELSDEIYTESTQVGTGSFIYRTTAGNLSIETGDAIVQYIDGNTIQTGHTDEVLEATGVFADTSTTAALAKTTWRAYVATDGTYTFAYDGTDWKLNDATVTLADYGLTVTGTVADGDTIIVDYTALVVGSLATATPTAFVATGFNQYDAAAGYAHVVGGNQYRIDGTYTSLGFTTTIGGTTTPVTVTNDRFAPVEDGYIYITGGSGNILIALVWSGTMDSEPYSAYSTATVAIPTVDAENNSLPTATYGMPSVHGVADRLSFADKTYLQRIGHYVYSAANLATVEALGVDYWYDTTDIFYVLKTPVTYTLADSASGAYTANDYGTEEITGTTVPVVVSIVYGNSLVDKLRHLLPIQSVGGGLTLTGTELSASVGQSTLHELTAADYNYPASNPAYVALWLLPTGLYGWAGSVSVRGAATINYSGNSGSALVLQGGGAAAIIAQTPSVYRASYAVSFTGTVQNTVSNGSLATLTDLFSVPSTKADVQIGSGAYAWGGGEGVAIGKSSYAQKYAVALGSTATATEQYSIAIGYHSSAGTKGEVSFGGGNLNNNGYNSSNYRLLSNVYDGQSAHDAATVGQITPLSDTTAPTTATVGTLGKIYIDTTNGDAYVCVAVDDVTPAYTWKKITA